MPHDPPEDRREERRHEDRGREARDEDLGADVWKIAKRMGLNGNSIILALVLGVTGTGGYGAWRVGGAASDKLDKHGSDLAALSKAQDTVAVKVDNMTALFSQVLASQGELKSTVASVVKNQDDLRVEIVGLKSAGTEAKVRDLDERCRKQAEEIAELRALVHEKGK